MTEPVLSGSTTISDRKQNNEKHNMMHENCGRVDEEILLTKRALYQIWLQLQKSTDDVYM